MSFKAKITPRRRAYVRLIGEIQRALNSALAEESHKRGLTQKAIAEALDKNKSVISRLFAGTSNMTLESLADLAYALDRPVKVSLPARHVPFQSNSRVLSDPPATSTPPSVDFGKSTLFIALPC